MRTLSVLALPFILLMAGCTSGTEEIAAVGAPGSASFDETRGAIQGTVTDESLLPIIAATIRIEGQTDVLTDNEGAFAFSLLEPGTYLVTATYPGYGEAAAKTDVLAGEVSTVTLRLASVASTAPYSATSVVVGRLGCGMAVAARPAALYQPANWCGVGTDYEYYGAPQLNDAYQVKVPIAVPDVTGLHGVVYETVWQSNQAFSSGFTVYWYVEGKVSGIPRVWDYYMELGVVEGRSPLGFSIDPEKLAELHAADPSFKDKCAVVADCKWGAAVYPYADTLGGAYPVDFSLYADQAYTHYVTEFVGAAPPDGFTALADS